MQRAGFAGAICTPHVGIDRYSGNTRHAIQERTAKLQADLDQHGVDFQLWTGGEIRLAKSADELLDRDETPRLAEGGYLLFDWWGKNWPEYLDEYFQTLIKEGFLPILAHPERLPLDDKLFSRTISRLLEMGVLLQGNLKSFAPQSEKRVSDRAKRILNEGQYYIIASDSHGPRSIPSRLDGLACLRELIDEATLSTLMAERPRQLIAVERAS